MSYSEYLPKHERPVITALLTKALEDGNTVSINDGEEYVVKRSTSINAIRSELAGTGEDWTVIRNSDGELLGQFYLIYDNGSEDDPMVVIADYSSNDYCNDLYNTLSDKYDI